MTDRDRARPDNAKFRAALAAERRATVERIRRELQANYADWYTPRLAAILDKEAARE